MKKILALGVTSSIGKATVKEFAKKGYSIVCAGRNPIEVKKVATDLYIRYGVVTDSFTYDAMKLTTHNAFIQKVQKKHPNTNTILILHGFLEQKDGIAIDEEITNKIITVNYSSIVSLTKAFVKFFPSARTIAVVTSVAGDRGKKALLHYNSAKAAASTYLEGLRKCIPHHVLDVKPGWVDTPMSYGSINSFIIATPEKVGKDIVKAVRKKQRVLYTPFFWRYVMFTLQHVPGKIYDKMDL